MDSCCLPRHSGFLLSGGLSANASNSNVFVGSCEYSWERVWGAQEEKGQGWRVEIIYIQYSCMKFSKKCKNNNNTEEINTGFFLAVQEVQVFHFGG